MSDEGGDGEPLDRPAVHMRIECQPASAVVTFTQDGKVVFWVRMNKTSARRWGEALIEASERLGIEL